MSSLFVDAQWDTHRQIAVSGARRHEPAFDPAFPLRLDCYEFSHEHRLSPNRRDYLELTLIVRGRGTFHAGERKFAARPGDVFAVDDRELHTLECEPGGAPCVCSHLFCP